MVAVMRSVKKDSWGLLGIIGALSVISGCLSLVFMPVAGIAAIVIGLLLNMAGKKTVNEAVCPACGKVLRTL